MPHIRQRRGLCIDGFAPHSQYNSTYSCWPAFITLYNLSSGMCMSSKYMFLKMVIPGPSNLKRLIDVYLELLIEELLQLWHMGVRTYDHATDWAFMIRAALMWTMNDLPAYGVTSGWNTTGVMGCPVCMGDTGDSIYSTVGRHATLTATNSFSLCTIHTEGIRIAFTKNRVENKVARPRLTGGQILDRVANISPVVELPSSLPDGYGSDHKWTKKSIFWYLPNWSSLLIRFNFDIMPIEKSVFDDIFNTAMDIKEKAKDNINTRKDLKIICNHPELELDERRPNVMLAVYKLGKDQKNKVCEWIPGLKFPDG
ncbi:UNVERIFIED_CONTAM: hypothetical protein Sradi_1316700 [Sesamum radiatum]|uniref:Uncharacterized protein n=1 Tax=Sesamum radiatum TaxID=300843 RepID=A0AAW2UQH4_SESRA